MQAAAEAKSASAPDFTHLRQVLNQQASIAAPSTGAIAEDAEEVTTYNDFTPSEELYPQIEHFNAMYAYAARNVEEEQRKAAEEKPRLTGARNWMRKFAIDRRREGNHERETQIHRMKQQVMMELVNIYAGAIDRFSKNESTENPFNVVLRNLGVWADNGLRADEESVNNTEKGKLLRVLEPDSTTYKYLRNAARDSGEEDAEQRINELRNRAFPRGRRDAKASESRTLMAGYGGPR